MWRFVGRIAVWMLLKTWETDERLPGREGGREGGKEGGMVVPFILATSLLTLTSPSLLPSL